MTTTPGTLMNQLFGTQAFSETETFVTKAFNIGPAQALAKESVTNSKQLYDNAIATAHNNAKAFTDIAETAWNSAKMLSEKALQNATANVEATFVAAHDIAAAKSLPDIGKIQIEFMQKLAAQASQQTKEFFDLSARATQHLLEKAQVSLSNPKG